MEWCDHMCVLGARKERLFSMTRFYGADWLSCFAAIVHVWRFADHLCFSQCVPTKDTSKTGKDWGMVAGYRYGHSLHAHKASAACWLPSS